ncbi:hypothetical protein [Candidatus Tisiphia endosymbiont of Hybos culiciformis]|uniref:hypothetical protein n=1 Tax=Candidatus Tisiphia endosymbiont of Hybos culiciformis TaxID=3139331 RepID=UPI003CCA81CC
MLSAITAIHITADQQVDIKYQIGGSNSMETVSFTCPSDAYAHVQNARTLASNGNLTEAMKEIKLAFEIRPNYRLALEAQDDISKLLASSTSLIDEISTPTTNSTITEKGATPAEPNSTQYNGDSIPTASPHKQSAEGQGWGEYLKDKVGGIVGAGVGVIGTAALLCAAYKVKQYCNKLKGVFVIENADTGNPDVYISLVPNNAANVLKLVEDNTDAGEQTDSIQVQMLGIDA